MPEVPLDSQASEANQAANPSPNQEAATRRAGTLARANAAMARTVGRLVEAPDIRNFVIEVLRVLAVEFDAVGTEFWTYDTVAGFNSALSFDRATDAITGEDNIFAALSKPGVPDDPWLFSGDNAGKIQYLREHDFDTVPWLRPYGDHLRSAGIKMIVGIPMFIREECFGSVTLRMTSQRSLDAAERELAFALAQQLALALQLTRLSEEARQAAIAIEQEKAAQGRANELAKANAAIRETLAALGANADIPSFLESILRTLQHNLLTPASTLWLYDEQTSAMSFQLMLLGETLIRDLRELGNGCFHSSYPWKPEDERARRGEAYFLPSLPKNHSLDEGTVTWLRQNGIAANLYVPMTVGNRVIGLFVVHKADSTPFTSQQIELATVLVQQAALAVHMSRLAEEAKQTTILREQEKAAQQRADALAKANAAMKQALDGIASATDLEESRQCVLAALIEHLDAVEGSLWRYNEGDKSLSLDMEYADGVFHKQNSVRFIHQRKHDWIGAHSPWLDANHDLLGGESMTFDVATSDRLQEIAKLDLLSKGAHTLVTLPLFASGRHLGCLALLLRPRRELSYAERELATALANQAALILETNRLATESRVAAQRQSIAEERNRIGGEIHDGLQQTLFALALQMGTATRMLERGDIDAAMRSMVTAAELAEHGGAEARRSVQALRPRALEETGNLPLVIEELCKLSNNQQLACKFELTGEARPLSHPIENTIFRVAQEACSNALKHSAATGMVIVLRFAPAEVVLEVSDNGRGMSRRAGNGSGYGMRTMQERADAVEGSLTVTSSPGEGTTVRLRIPLPPSTPTIISAK